MRRLDRYLRIRFIAAEPEAVLTKLTSANVEIWDVEWIDYLTVVISVHHAMFSQTKRILQQNEIHYSVIKKEGIVWNLWRLRQRPVLVTGLILFLFLAWVLPGRIFFVRVAGNEVIPETKILQQAQACGIRFGTKAADVRSENIKNYLLGQMPELQWLGVTTSGCVATIHVVERSTAAESVENDGSVSSIVAVHDGVITKMSVSKGSPLFQSGQSVKAGDVLISGYTDCGLKVTAQQADGEIFAHTLHEIEAIALLPTAERGEFIRTHTCYRLRIGKKVINLCNHSGIPDATCVKMYSEDYWTLPGGFQLPVSLIKVECSFYELSAQTGAEEDYAWLPQCAREYLLSQMIAGEVLDEALIWNSSEDFCELKGIYACHEMIGRVKQEEIVEQYAEDN